MVPTTTWLCAKTSIKNYFWQQQYRVYEHTHIHTAKHGLELAFNSSGATRVGVHNR